MANVHGGQNLITVFAQLSGGDRREVKVNLNNPLDHLLKEALKAFFPPPNMPDPSTYQLIFNGTILPDLSMKVGDAGIKDQDTVILQPGRIGSG